jgi:P pilus assembly chaperone PapD
MKNFGFRNMKAALMLMAFVMLFPLASDAQVKGLLISPKRVVFEPGERVREVRLVNRGDETQKYRISIVNRKMQENGQLAPADEPGEGEYFADKVLRYGPKQVELGAKEAQTVRLMSRIKGDSADGEYRSHILIQEIPKAADAESATGAVDDGLGVNVQAIFGISIPVFFRKGDLTSSVSLSNPDIIKENDSTYVRFNIERSGNKSIFGTAKVFADGQEVAILKGIAVYLSAPYRTISVEVPEEYAQTLAGKKLRVTFSAVETEEDSPSAELSFNAP